MARLFVSADEEGFLKEKYLLELWKAILEHAPQMMGALEARCPKRYEWTPWGFKASVKAWCKEYGLPVEFEEYAETYIYERIRFQRTKEAFEAYGSIFGKQFEEFPEGWLGPEWYGGKYRPISPLVRTRNSKRPRPLPVTRFLEEIYDRNALSYDPSRFTRNQWLKLMLRRLDGYCDAVEDLYKKAGWKAKATKYELSHFKWLALKLEGLSYGQIADKFSLADPDTVRKAVKRLSALLGVSPPPSKQ